MDDRETRRYYPNPVAGHVVSVQVPAREVTLAGDLGIPADPKGVVLFAHGSGSSRHSPRNRLVADYLHQVGLATLLFDLLTPEEERVDQRTAELRFDIELLAHRLIGATAWVAGQRQLAGLKLGYFGASTGAAAALVAAAGVRHPVGAIVSRGGRPDLAGTALARVRAPTLLIVGGEDRVIIDLNRDALEHLECEKRLEIIPGATHLFEQAGALEQVAGLAREWFNFYLRGQRHRPAA